MHAHIQAYTHAWAYATTHAHTHTFAVCTLNNQHHSHLRHHQNHHLNRRRHELLVFVFAPISRFSYVPMKSPSAAVAGAGRVREHGELGSRES